MWDDDTLRHIFDEDGQIHTVQAPRKPSSGRKNVINDITFRDAYVCLTCDKEVCDGERKCFLERKRKLKKELQEKEEKEEK